MRQLNPKKLLLSKWTAVKPVNKEKHFLVRSVVPSESPEFPVEQFELEAVHSGRAQIIHWRDLQDEAQWLQGGSRSIWKSKGPSPNCIHMRVSLNFLISSD